MFRTWLAAPIVLMALATWLTPDAAASDVLDADLIKVALKTATPEEEGFVETAVALARAGILPPSLVESTFQWARKKPHRKFQYFKRALLLRAAEQGVRL